MTPPSSTSKSIPCTPEPGHTKPPAPQLQDRGLSSRPEIGAHRLGFAPDVVGAAVRDHPAEVERDHLVADPHDQTYVMLDQQHGDAAPVADGADFIGEPIDFRVVSPPAGSSSSNSFGRFGERARKLHPLANAKGNAPAGRSATLLRPNSSISASAAQQSSFPRALPAALRAHWPGIRRAQSRARQHTRFRAPSWLKTGRRSGTSARRQARRVHAWSRQQAGGRRRSIDPARRVIETRDAVEERRLAGAVWANEAADCAAGNLKGYVLERGHAANRIVSPRTASRARGLEVPRRVRASSSRLGQLHALPIPHARLGQARRLPQS